MTVDEAKKAVSNLKKNEPRQPRKGRLGEEY